MASIFETTPKNYRYYSPTPGEITLMAAHPNLNDEGLDENLCKKIKDCGFNATTAFIVIASLAASLNNCFAQGIKLFPRNKYLTVDPQDFINSYCKRNGFGGFFLSRDLPFDIKNEGINDQILQTYQSIFNIYKSASPNSNELDINMPPVYLGINGDWTHTSLNEGTQDKPKYDYPKQIANFQKLYQPAFWPVFYIPDLYDSNSTQYDIESRLATWYKDLQYFSYIARYTSTPFWMSCRCQRIFDFPYDSKNYHTPAPTLNTLRGTVFTALAYGAQGIYYWDFRRNTPTNYFDAPLEMDGTPTTTYDMVKTVNEEVKSFGKIFCDCEMIDCRHFVTNNLSNTLKTLDYAMGPLMSIENSHATHIGVLVSHIFKDNKNYLILVGSPFDKEPRNPRPFTLKFSPYYKISRCNRFNNEYIEEPISTYDMSVRIHNGDYLIFSWV